MPLLSQHVLHNGPSLQAPQTVLQGSSQACEAECTSGGTSPPSLTPPNRYQQPSTACWSCASLSCWQAGVAHRRAPTGLPMACVKACLQIHGLLLRSGGLQLSHSLVEVLLQSLGSPVLVLSMLLRSLQSGHAAACVCLGTYLLGLQYGQASVALDSVLYPAVWGELSSRFVHCAGRAAQNLWPWFCALSVLLCSLPCRDGHCVCTADPTCNCEFVRCCNASACCTSSLSLVAVASEAASCSRRAATCSRQVS